MPIERKKSTSLILVDSFGAPPPESSSQLSSIGTHLKPELPFGRQAKFPTNRKWPYYFIIKLYTSSLLVFSQHPAWFIEPIYHYRNVRYIA